MCITDHSTDGKRIHSTWKSQSFPTSCKRRFPQFHDMAGYTYSHSAYYCEHPFLIPSWIKENKSIKKIRSTAAAHINGSRTPFSYLEKWRKSTLFPIILPRREAEDKSYCLCILSLAEPKKSSVFNPFPASFLSYLSDRVDRQQFRFGSSACSYGYIFCRSCCTAACHSLQEKSSIPVSISYCGS